MMSRYESVPLKADDDSIPIRKVRMALVLNVAFLLAFLDCLKFIL